MVIAYTELLARRYEGRLDAEASRCIAYAASGAKRIESLLHGLREYWQVGATSPPAPVPVDCDQALAAALANLETAIAAAGATIIADPLPPVLANQTAVIQVLQNLVGNAVKYRSPERPPRIVISAKESGGWCVFSVEDNGIGIEPEYFDRIFMIFRRLHGHGKPGAGMGLSIAQKIVERYGGRMWVDSAPGQGSVFRFSLPAAGNSSATTGSR
jgi:light-regulated signal transduction histidine kinase (bacteriophytochrome)